MTEQSPDSGNVVIKDGNATGKFTTPAPASVEHAREGGVMRTAKAPHGGTLSREPTAKDIVTVSGVEMPLATALKHGFVKQNSDGSFSDLDQAAQTAAVERASAGPEAKSEAFDDSHALSFTDEQAEALTGLSAMMGEAGYNPVGVIGEALTHGENLPPSLLAAARQRGVPDADAQAQYLRAAYGIKEGIGEYVIESAGVSREQLDAFWNYVDKTVPPTTLSSMVAQAAFMGNARPFADVARRFQVSHGSGKGSAQTTETRRRGYAGQGTVETINVRGVGRVSLEAARRLKIV